MSISGMLAELQKWKNAFGPGQARRVERLLGQLARRRILEPAALIELHEIALFLAAYPPNAAVRRSAERLLESFGERVRELERSGDDLEAFEEPEVSGIAGTHLTAVFSYEIARHLSRRHGDAVRIDWERNDEASRVQETVPHLIPLLDDDAMVEAEVPWRDWIEAAAGGGGRDLRWLLDQIEKWEPTPRLRADRYQTLSIPLRWDFGDSTATRTHMRLPARRVFYHARPLIRRAEVRLEEIPSMPPLPSRRVGSREAAAIITLARDTSAARFRELWGFTYAAPESMLKFDAGRGAVLYIWGVPAAQRLPLRAYHGATIWKNGVPIGYFEALSVFERMEAGFNLYYTFREGETAWLYRQLLKIFHQLLGVTVIAIDPYQIGHGNDEAIDSGAFWFYRKLGFRPVDAAVQALTAREEERIAERPGYRSSRATLRRLVESPMVFEMPGAKRGAWDRFSVRNLGMAAAKAMGRRYGGDLVRMRQHDVREMIRIAGWNVAGWNDAERRVLGEWAPLLALMPEIRSWEPGEYRLLASIVKAKAGPDESQYLRRMQRHGKLRAAMLRVGESRE